jgi:hypothetical protein
VAPRRDAATRSRSEAELLRRLKTLAQRSGTAMPE